MTSKININNHSIEIIIPLPGTFNHAWNIYYVYLHECLTIRDKDEFYNYTRKEFMEIRDSIDKMTEQDRSQLEKRIGVDQFNRIITFTNAWRLIDKNKKE